VADTRTRYDVIGVVTAVTVVLLLGVVAFLILGIG
jgi:hypothetical protein